MWASGIIKKKAKKKDKKKKNIMNNTFNKEQNVDNIEENFLSNKIEENQYNNNIKINTRNNLNELNNVQILNKNNSFNNFHHSVELNSISKNIYDEEKEREENQDEEEEEEEENEEDENDENNKKESINEKLINKKCSLNEHSETEAINFCQECKIYMCNKCDKVHSGLLKNHHTYNLNKNDQNIFTGFCPEINHSMKLEYYCKTHNKLCCAACISKIKSNGNGKHKNCKVFGILKIRNKKKNLLKKNVKKLTDLSDQLIPSIDELKKIFELINEKKEKIKEKVQKLFTEIRNALNEREDKLLLEVDNKFDELFFNEEFIKKCEKLPNLVKISLGKNDIKENDWEDESILNKLINTSIDIENNINDINIINTKMDSYKSKKDIEFELEPKRNDINKFLEDIKKFGKINIIDKLKESKQNLSLNINFNNLIEIPNMQVNPINNFEFNKIPVIDEEGLNTK